MKLSFLKSRKAVTAGVVAAALAMSGALSACSGDKDADKTTVNVYAAASLKATYEQIEKDFEAENPDINIEFNFAGSQTLVEQITNGAEADVFASADEKNMNKAIENNIIDGEPTPFVTNVLTIAVSPGNPKGITDLKSLENPDLKVVICAEGVPCGNATKKVVDATGLKLTPVSEEQAVPDVLGKVTSGEADAGLVYKTDVMGSKGKAEAVDFPESANAVNTYPIAIVSGSKHKDEAQKFIDYVLSDKGQKIFEDAGFGIPKK